MLERAQALHQQGKATEAEAIYHEVLALHPNEPNALHLLGVAAWQRNDLPLAEDNILKAITFNPHAPGYYTNLAGVLQQKGDLPDAITAYESALKLTPQDATIQRNLAMALHKHGLESTRRREWDVAKAAYLRVLDLDPNNAATLNNLASIFQHHNDRKAAMELYNRGLAALPDNLMLRYNRSICLLTDAHLKEGWADFTASKDHWNPRQDNRPNLPWLNLPLWDGAQDIRGKTILVWGDYGIGDEIIYAGLIPDLIKRGAIITIECTDRLVPLFARAFPGTKILPRQSPPLPNAAYDYQASYLWLARCLRPSLESFQAQQSFLVPDAAQVQRLRAKYRAHGKKRIIGISWHTKSRVWGEHRSMDLNAILALQPLDDTLFIDLQYGPTEEALQQAKQAFPNLAILHDDEIDQFKDMDAFAAQVAACDAVLTICNTTPHVSGALGVPTVVLMSDVGLTWYWFTSGRNCPWYPSLTILRPDEPDRLAQAAEMIAKFESV